MSVLPQSGGDSRVLLIFVVRYVKFEVVVVLVFVVLLLGSISSVCFAENGIVFPGRMLLFFFFFILLFWVNILQQCSFFSFFFNGGEKMCLPVFVGK